MGIDVSLELYKVFCTAVRTGSMSLAADELFVSQPAVSMAVKQLEQKLEKPLLVRSPKGLHPTAEGAVLYEYLSQAMNFVGLAEKKYMEMARLETGEIRIGASDTILSHYLLPYIERYREMYSGINIKVTNRTSYETIGLLKSGQVDLGFVNLPLEEDGNLDISECMAIHDCAVGGRKFRELCGGGIKIGELGDYPLLLLERDSNSRRYIDRWFGGQGIDLKPVMELGSYDLLSKFAAINLGITFAVREFSGEYFDRGVLFEIPLEPAIPARGVGLVRMKGAAMSYSAEKFVGLIKM